MKTLRNIIQEKLVIGRNTSQGWNYKNSELRTCLNDFESNYHMDRITISTLRNDAFYNYKDDIKDEISKDFDDDIEIFFRSIYVDSGRDICKLYEDIVNYVLDHENDLDILYKKTFKSDWIAYVIDLPDRIFCVTGEPKIHSEDDDGYIIWQYK